MASRGREGGRSAVPGGRSGQRLSPALALGLAAGLVGNWGQAATAPSPSPAALSATIGPASALPALWGALGATPTAASDAAPPLQPAAEPTPPPTPTPSPRPSGPANAVSDRAPGATDAVSAVVIQAQKYDPSGEGFTPGPAWWRVQNGQNTLWIMATPDIMPTNTAFDDGPLKARIEQASRVIVPNKVSLDMESLAGHESEMSRTANLPPKTPLSERLPPDILARLNQRIANDPQNDRFQNANARLSATGIYVPSNSALITIKTPNSYSSAIEVAMRLASALDLPGALGNPAADEAYDLALRSGKLAGRLPNSASDLVRRGPANPSEVDQAACLGRVLDQLDGGWTGVKRLQGLDAWARGDAAGAMKRYSVISTCSFGTETTRFWTQIVGQYVQRLDAALNQPGISVAIVEFDPLQIKGGVLDQLRAKGYSILAPEGG
ncbi:MAG: hypothetical protein JWM33_1041 [Caulobacteraceae bacterium]|nr:hypothetical protein [Caulobacteraceae bacterium]